MTMANNNIAEKPALRELLITRAFRAPCERVFRAWTDPVRVAEWWGPKGFTNPMVDVDARPGGVIRIGMRGPDGIMYPVQGVFLEVFEPQQLMFTTSAIEGKDGVPQLETLNTAAFAPRGAGTELTLRVVIIKHGPGTDDGLAGMEEGWTQSLDRLAAYLEKA